jgi:SPP1 gp7 family putative phage head morphogenesis protein
MDEEYRRAVIERVKPRFHGKESIQSRASWNRPDSAERDYKRLMRELNIALAAALREALPKIKAILDRRYSEMHRYDSQESDLDEIRRILEDALKGVAVLQVMKKLEKELDLIRKSVESTALKEWSKAVKRTLGIDLFTDYYRGDTYRQLVDQWVRDNVDLISKIPDETVGRMRDTVFQGWYEGKSSKTIAAEMQRQYGIERRRAELIAVDQTAKLNSQITQYQQREAGVEEYIWSTCRDKSVRQRHRELHGKKFRWDEPPVVDVKNNRRCHPGEDYRCRCVAIPVFNTGSLDVTIQDADWNAIDERYRQRKREWAMEKRELQKARQAAAAAKKK